MTQDEVNRLNGVLILLVEDNPAHQELITEAIKESCALVDVMCLGNGTDAVGYLLRDEKFAPPEGFRRPSLIVLDLKLPGMSGKEILKIIKTDVGTRTIPVVMLSSSNRDEDIRDCYELGANSYVMKPSFFGEFMEKVKGIPEYWFNVNLLPGGANT